MEVFDSAANESASVTADWTDLPTIAAGDTCDPEELTEICADGYGCDEETSTCVDAATAACAGAETLTAGSIAEGTIVQYNSNTEGTCAGNGPETVYELTLAEDSDVFLTTNLPGVRLDTVLHVRSTCDDDTTEVGCNDDYGDWTIGESQSELELTGLAAGTYYVFVDTWTSGGDYRIQATVTPL